MKRTAVATAAVSLDRETSEIIRKGLVRKGDPLACARIAGIAAAKRTGGLIPLCHPLPIEDVSVDLTVEGDSVKIRSTVVTTAKTGVEMEALTAVTVAALTVYDMCKAVDRSMVIGEIKLESKEKEPIG